MKKEYFQSGITNTFCNSVIYWKSLKGASTTGLSLVRSPPPLHTVGKVLLIAELTGFFVYSSVLLVFLFDEWVIVETNLQRIHNVISYSMRIWNGRIFTYPDSAINAIPKMFGILSINIFIDDAYNIIHVNGNACRFVVLCKSKKINRQ